MSLPFFQTAPYQLLRYTDIAVCNFPETQSIFFMIHQKCFQDYKQEIYTIRIYNYKDIYYYKSDTILGILEYTYFLTCLLRLA